VRKGAESRSTTASDDVVLRSRKARFSYPLSLRAARGGGSAVAAVGEALRKLCRAYFGAAFDSKRRVHSARMRSRFWAMKAKSMAVIAAGAAVG
jgi:hypothetical protein